MPCVVNISERAFHHLEFVSARMLSQVLHNVAIFAEGGDQSWCKPRFIVVAYAKKRQHVFVRKRVPKVSLAMQALFIRHS